jgi:hypothetical protein
MSYKVVYFTRTGTSKRIAEKIAEKLACEVIQIIDNKNWSGILGYIKAGYYASARKPVEINVSKKIETGDKLVVVAPFWAGDLAPAIKKFLETVPKENIDLVIDSGSSIVDNLFGCKSVRCITKKSGNEDAMILDLVNSL